MAASSATLPPYLHVSGQAVLLDLHVQPRASRSEIAGMHGDRLKVHLAAPPVEGKANRELCRFLADTFGVAASQTQLVGGAQGRRKRVRLGGLSAAEVVEKVGPSREQR